MTTGKQAIREHVWNRLEQAGAVDPGVSGYIPDFRGAVQAADRLAALPEWQHARVVKAVPDRAQYPVRLLALQAGKVVYMAVPKLAAPSPFLLLDPRRLTVDPRQAADRETAAAIAPLVDTGQMRPVGLIVCGSVAVNPRGARLGKGAGYSDLEFALLTEAGLIGEHTAIATTVHDLQVLDDDLPEEDHDFRVDLIITPERVTRCERARRPHGIDWTRLTPEQIAAVPALARRTTG